MRRDFINQPVLRSGDVLAGATRVDLTDMERVFGEHDGERCDKWRQYLPIYDRHLGRFRGSPVRMLEIGVANGGSFEIWRRYLGADACLHGLDISRSDEAIRCLAQVGATLHFGDQKDAALLQGIAAQMGGLDVVLDDGSHDSVDQIRTFETLYPLLAPGGIYLCEDTHTSYFASFREGNTFVEFAKRKVDELHSWYLDDSVGISDAFALQTSAVLFYDSVVVFERALEGKTAPRRVIVGRDG